MIFNEDEIKSLNYYQKSGCFHPYTCRGEHCREDLIATEEGWKCPKCDYTQNWAHDFSKNWSWLVYPGFYLNLLSFYQIICEKHNIKFNKVEKDDENCQLNGEDLFLDRSWCVFGEIWLGIYEDREKELISFFHELSHILRAHDDKIFDSKYEQEKYIWEQTFPLAEQYGFIPSDATKEWCNIQLETYK